VIAALTIWTLLACFLLFPLLGLRPLLHRTAATLLAAEGIALMMWHYGSEGCRDRPCGTVAEVGHSAAAIDIPVLTVALVALAVARGVRAHRRAPRTTPTSSAPRVSVSRGTGRRPAPSSARDTSDRADGASSCASSRADRSGRA
jgi:hypothetical protein